MVQILNGHNEKVSGDINWTWQDSCDRFPEVSRDQASLRNGRLHQPGE